jgi:hypothetical protein
MLNTFIEPWLAELFPDIEQVPYPIGDARLILINDSSANLIKELLSIHAPTIIPSTIDGAVILVTTLWVDATLLDAASSTESKRLTVYQMLLERISTTLFTINERQAIVSSLISPSITPPVVEKPFELFSNRFLTFGNDEAFIDDVNSIYRSIGDNLLELSRRINKPVILLTTTRNQVVNKPFFDMALKIIVMNEMISGFSILTASDTMCLGLKVSGLYIPKPKELSKSPYAEYDSILKDNFNNVIFAIGKDDAVIITIQNPAPTHIKEICIRYKSDQDFRERDIELYRGYLQENKRNYMRVAKDSSEKIIKELKAKAATLLTEYQTAMDTALEKAKLFNTINNQVEYFDQSKFDQDQNKKFDENYQMTCDLDRVQSIIIKDDGLVIVNTKEIYVQDERDKKWHDIGTFQITIGMHMPKYNTEQTVRIKNTKYSGCHGSFQAPHVFEAGNICHGNIESMMIEAYKNKNLYELVFIILQFLKSANTSDAAGQYVNLWPEVTEDLVKGVVPEKKELKVNIPIHIGERTTE